MTKDRVSSPSKLNFGWWVVLNTKPGKAKHWLCRCQCGTEKLVQSQSLREGKSTSCGCSVIKHGMRYTSEYKSWLHMKYRCLNQNSAAFKDYGGRGIKIEWEDFESFFKDMGKKPSPKHSIDRIDNDGNYSKKNCRWATQTQQSNNTRQTILISYKGKEKPLRTWAIYFGIKPKTLWARLHNYKWSIEKALTTPVK